MLCAPFKAPISRPLSYTVNIPFPLILISNLLLNDLNANCFTVTSKVYFY